MKLKYTAKRFFSNSLIMAVAASPLLLGSCSDFLKQDPLSFYEPTKTYTTEAGLKAALITSDKHLRDYYMTPGNMITEYIFSDLGVRGTTDQATMFTNIDERLTPTSMPDNTGWFWSEGYAGVKYANTVLTYIDKVPGLTDEVRNKYMGQAYFHRSFRYLLMTFLYDNVPLLTKLTEVPKQDYGSTKREAIIKMLVENMEFAVQWVPSQEQLTTYGEVNKEACRQLLIKCYLAAGEFQKAKEQADTLIGQSGHSLMESTFGTFNAGGESKTWKITDNVIWDLHRPENKLIPANKETLLGVVDRGSGSSFISYETMRSYGPYWNDPKITGADGKPALKNWARSNTSDYNENYDYLRAIGRGIAALRPSWYATHSVWQVDGKDDNGDLRHSSKVGNWFPMDSLKYNDKASVSYGKSFADAKPACADTVRSWFDFPHYKTYLEDKVSEDNLSATQFNGSSKGSVSDWYVYRLAETYLLRAEAEFYLGDPASAAKDVNAVRKRAGCEMLYPEDNTFTIGAIMDERARELYLEEFRHAELSRVSYCLAMSGKPDEWGNTYSLENYDKQEGTDLSGGSYWYQRVIHHNDFYRAGNEGATIAVNGKVFTYKINKHNLYFPVPNSSITKNSLRKLWQNFGYDGYDAGITMWDNWQDAVADEDKTN